MRRIAVNLIKSRTTQALRLTVMLVVSAIVPSFASATVGQTSITLLGGVSTVVQQNNTSWASAKTLNSISPDPGDPLGNSGVASWTVTVTKTSVSDTFIEADGYLTVQNTGAYPATIGNIVVNLQQFKKSCKGSDGKTYKNIWVSQAADLADGDHGASASTDNIAAAASQEVVAANQGCGAKNYTTQTYSYQKAAYTKGTFIISPGSGTIEFDYLGNTTFSTLSPGNVIPAGQSVTFTYVAKFDNTQLNLPAGTQIRTETIVTFGNAGARGGSGAAIPNLDIDGDGYVDTAEGEAWVRSVPTRTSLEVPATCVQCNQQVTLADTPNDITTTGDVTANPATFSFTANGGDTGVTQLTDKDGNTYFSLDGSQIATGASDTFTVAVGYSVVDCSNGTISNTAHLDTYQYPVLSPYSWDANGDLLLQIGTDGNGNPINVIICAGLDQAPSDSNEPIVSGDNSCQTDPPPSPYSGNYCTFLQSQWPGQPGGATLGSLVNVIGSATIGTGGTYTATWDSANAIKAYLPASGTNGALNASLTDATNTSAGHFGGELLALQLNADLGTSGVQVNGNAVSDFGSLRLCGTGTPLDGSTVDQVLALANKAVGGGGLPADCTGQGTCDFNSLDVLLQHLNVSFQQCHLTGFGLHHLVEGSSCP